MWIEIEALDTLFFKDGKPFSMGEETWADGIFPPPPSVVFGTIRSAYMSQINQSLTLANEPGDKSKNLVIEDYCLSIDNTPHYPMPLDLVLKKNRTKNNSEEKKDKYQVQLLHLINNHLISSNQAISKILTADDEVETLNSGYIDKIELEKYLAGEADSFTATKIDNKVIIEPKVGIGRNDTTRTTQESKLYRVGMRRLNDVKLILQVENLDDLWKDGLLKLGGEAKAAKYQQLNISLIEQPKMNYKRFKIYLATPALLEQGWLPKWINAKSLKGTYPGTKIEVQLIAAAIGKPIPIGGFDMKKRKPKPMLQALPAGSVYYFDCIGDYSGEALDTIMPIKFCDYPEKIYEGYGISYMGNVK